MGLDLDDVVIVPVGSAQALFDQESLFRILVQVRSGTELHRAARMVSKAIAARHEGENDVTVITQDSVVNTLGRVLRAVTVGIAVISAISLAVAGILIMNVMLVSVAQRGAEIGLLKALGARSRDVRALFLIEAVLLASLGALSGVVVGVAGTHLVRLLYRAIPVEIPLWAFFGASGAAVVVGLVFGLMPARRAAMMDPVDAMAQR
ncbi:MAG: putative ABC transport system permease protein [Gammaproteobacteria bacterium]